MKFVVLGLSAIAVCLGAAAGPVTVSPEGALVRNLSEYNLFSDLAAHEPNDGVVAYDLNTPLFTDYATKNRFIWMPEGTSATYHDTEAFDFPVGTAITKTFSYPSVDDPATLRHIETRVLLHRKTGWVALPYIWNDEQTDAKLAVAGGRDTVQYTLPSGEEKTIGYVVPNMNQCKACHENNEVIGPIGPKARHLNRDYEYPHGTQNQLARLVEEGYLTGAPEHADAPKLPVWTDTETWSLDERARAYLDINCAHCHNPSGPAFTSGLDLSWQQLDPRQYGVYKPPVAAGRGSGGHKFGIVPKHPEQSILVHRMESLDPGSMMPNVGRSLIHDEGIELIANWVKGMEPSDFKPENETGGGDTP